MRLATLLHVSDLHFGDVGGDGAVVHSRLAKAIWTKFPVFDGLLGHGSLALWRLAQFWKTLRAHEENVHLAVTGDVTAYGSAAQFDMASSYLASELVPPYGDHFGLGVRSWADYSVPGNHDHWPGYPIIFGAGREVSRRFTVPFVSRLPLANGRSLRFIRIDTDANVGSLSLNRLHARGAFESHLPEISRLEPPNSDDIVVLLLHHAPSYRSPSGSDGKLEIVQGSLDDLRVFVVEQDVAVMLCGHVHGPRISQFHARHDGRAIEVLEARCGTTTQLDRLPFGFRGPDGRRPKRRLPPNTLLVHKIDGDRDEVLWSVETYRRRPDGFEPHERMPPTEPVRVWPRQ